MAATEARIGYGTKFLLATPEAPTVYVAIAEVTSLQLPGNQRDIHEASHMESPDMYKEYIPGMRDGGEVQLDLNFVPGSETTQRIFEAGGEQSTSQAKIQFPNGEEWGFACFCTDFQATSEPNAPMTATCTFKVTGPVDITDPS